MQNKTESVFEGRSKKDDRQRKFQKTFSKLHASPDLLTEVVGDGRRKAGYNEKEKISYSEGSCGSDCMCGCSGSGTAAYAMNVGGIQRTIQIWIHGDQTDAQFVVEDGSYTLDYEDENGEASTQRWRRRCH